MNGEQEDNYIEQIRALKAEVAELRKEYLAAMVLEQAAYKQLDQWREVGRELQPILEARRFLESEKTLPFKPLPGGRQKSYHQIADTVSALLAQSEAGNG